MLTPQAEARELAHYWAGVTKAASPTCAPQAQRYDLDATAVAQALHSLPGHKAAPAHYAPHFLWKVVADPVAQLLDRSLLQEWRAHQVKVPTDWADAWLTFLQKANKAGNKPEHLRPIALLDPWARPFRAYSGNSWILTYGPTWRLGINMVSCHSGRRNKH